jgi:hypothetical protein
MSPAARPNPWLEIVVTIVAPSLVLMQASGDTALGPTRALLLALALPLAWGLNSWRRVAVVLSAFTRKPLIHALLLHPTVFDVPRLQAALHARGTAVAFAGLMRRATVLFGLSFFVSAVLNYALARWLVSSPSGSEAFNAELGRYTLLSWPALTVPSLAMTAALLWWMARGFHRLAGLRLGDLLGPRTGSG